MPIPRSPVLLAAATLLALAVGISAQPAPQVATAVGQDTCATCHEDYAKQFDRSAHGHLATWEQRGLAARCESCHGPGSLHAENGGDKTMIVGFGDEAGPRAIETCLTCHRGDHAMEWAGSTHAVSGVGCTSCHRIHQSREVLGRLTSVEGMTKNHAGAPAEKGSLKKAEAQLCYECHKEQRAQFLSASHHPVREGLMTCSSCHDPHGRNLGMLKTEERTNELCTQCHAKQAGPFVFEHAPVEESCMTCHNPHGTVANNLLKQGEPFLCLQCHEMHFHNARLTTGQPFYLPTGGSENRNGVTSFMGAYNTRCTNCHNKVHGSDLPSQGVSGQGQAFTR